MPERLISRRDFLKIGGLVVSSVILDACAPSLAQKLSTATSTFDNNLTNTELPTQIPTQMQTPEPKEPAPKVWELSLVQRVELMTKPEFFTELQGENTKKIITHQFEDDEYIRLNRKAFHNNSCGQSTLTTIAKMCGFLNTGNVPDITIADVYTALDGKMFTDIKGYTDKYIVWDDQMYFVGLPDALKNLIPQFISKIEFITPNYGARYTRIVPQSEWANVLSKAQAVCEDGGFVIIGCLKYGGGHILLATNVTGDGTAMIVDSYSGKAQKVLLENYFEWWVYPNAEHLGKQPGLLNMISITPKLSTSS